MLTQIGIKNIVSEYTKGESLTSISGSLGFSKNTNNSVEQINKEIYTALERI